VRALSKVGVATDFSTIHGPHFLSDNDTKPHYRNSD
jgi:hypothetical protein